MYIGQEKDIKVKFYPENKSKDYLSTPDHLSPRNSKEDEEQSSTISELVEHDDGDIEEISNASSTNSSTQKKFPIISEVIHIESY